MKTILIGSLIVIVAGCSRADQKTPRVVALTSVCAHPANGIIVARDSMAGLPMRAPMKELVRLWPAGDTALYDAVGWQAMSRVFPFTGARIAAVQSKQSFGEALDSVAAADLWTAEGDSVRMPDGVLLPRTLGELRARYGRLIVDQNTGGDDIDGPGALACRYPYIRFFLEVNDTARKVPDSSRVTRVEVSANSTAPIEKFCAEHVPR